MKTVLIVGIARGGTSLTAGLVAQLGVHITTQVPKARQLKWNPKGMFEHTDFMFANGIGQRFRPALDSLKVPDFSNVPLKEIQQAKNVIKKHSKGHNLWGYKNLDNYSLDVTIPLHTNPHIIIVSRSLVDNAKSLQIHSAMPFPEAYRRAALGTLLIANALQRLGHKKVPRVYTCYENIRNKPLEEAKRIADFLGIKMTPEIEAKVIDFVDPDMRTWKEKGKGVFHIND